MVIPLSSLLMTINEGHSFSSSPGDVVRLVREKRITVQNSFDFVNIEKILIDVAKRTSTRDNHHLPIISVYQYI